MKVLVCAASKYGATGEIAKAVADVLADRGLDVAVIPPERASAIEQFDAVVLGSAVYMGRLVRKHLSFPDRAMASAIRAQEGDFRNWAESGTGQPASPAPAPRPVSFCASNGSDFSAEGRGLNSGLTEFAASSAVRRNASQSLWFTLRAGTVTLSWDHSQAGKFACGVAVTSHHRGSFPSLVRLAG